MTALKALGTALVLTGAAGAQFMIFDDPAHDPLVLSGLLLASLGFMTRPGPSTSPISKIAGPVTSGGAGR